MSEIPVCWFAARTRACQELSVRKRLQQQGVEIYLPTTFVLRRLKNKMKEVEKPIIHNLIFVRCTKPAAFALLNDFAIPIGFIKDGATNTLLVIPDKQMEDFRTVMDSSLEKTLYGEGELAAGDKVIVVEGELAGIEGTMIRMEGRTHVAIRIIGVIVAVVKIPRANLKKIKAK
jgi:transcription antitermination factor NusG